MLDIFSFLTLLILFLYSGMRGSKRVAGEENYLFAGRKTGLFSLAATLVMTELNTATLIAFSSLGFIVGKRALLMPFIFLLGLLFYALTVAKKWKEYDGLSVAGFFTQKYGKGVGKLASLFLLIAMAGFSASYVKSLALLFLPYAPFFNQWTLSGCLTLIVLLMTWRGGLISIIKTDKFSFVLFCLFFPFLAFMAKVKGAPIITDQPALILPGKFILSLIVLTLFTYILAPWYGQKMFAAKNAKIAWQAVALSALMIFVFYGCATYATYRLSGVSLSSPELALETAMTHFLPKGLIGLGFALLFAAAATTLTGVWNAMCSLVVGDFNLKGHSLPLTGILALVSFLLANLLVDRIFDKLILANIPVAALSFALLGGFYWKKASRLGAILSIIMGMLVGGGTFLFFGEEGGYTWYWAMGGIPLIFIAGIIGSLLDYRKGKVIVSYGK